jgi:uncharacterized protein (TIGR02145 family)
MKNSFIIILSIVSFCALAQTSQNINKNSGTVSNVLTNIDSIRFNGSSTTMEVILQNGAVESHAISDIQNVNFVSVSQSQHSCGSTNVHNPNMNYGTVTDHEGNLYKTIVIGTQEWMAENLKTSIYRNGDEIPTGLSDDAWSDIVNTQQGAYSYYNNDSLNNCPYGKLYNWYAVADPRNLCPIGWHVPTEAELSVLINYFDPSSNGGVITPNVAGGKLKNTGTLYWQSPNTDATNVSGFSGLPGGSRADIFDGLRYNCTIWSSSSNEINTDNAWYLDLYHNHEYVFKWRNSKTIGRSVRCLKD